MKQISIILFVATIATSCAIGTYYPYAQNHFGAESKVVLNQANFRVVRDVEAIVDVNNTRLTRAAVANSAYGELLRKAHLQGSQVLINVVIEEVRRESGGFFRLLSGIPKRVQHVAARATIIEFLDEHRNPTGSEVYRSKNQQEIKISSSNSTPAVPPKTDYLQRIQNQMAQLGWTTSILYKNYYTVVDLLRQQNNKQAKEQLHKVSVVINKIINNELSKDQVEIELSKAIKNGEEPLQVFLSYY